MGQRVGNAVRREGGAEGAEPEYVHLEGLLEQQGALPSYHPSAWLLAP